MPRILITDAIYYNDLGQYPVEELRDIMSWQQWRIAYHPAYRKHKELAEYGRECITAIADELARRG